MSSYILKIIDLLEFVRIGDIASATDVEKKSTALDSSIYRLEREIINITKFLIHLS
nr:hypothetical protein [uncultured Flavobacterium sp.]